MRRLVVPVAVGLAFGLLVRLGDGGTGEVPWLVNIGGPWVVLAFAVGRRTPRRPAVSATACLLAAVVAKYGLQVAQGDIAFRSLVVRLVAWGIAAVLIGSVVGASGARAGRGSWWPWTLVGAVLAVEAVCLLTGVIDGESAHLRYDGQAAATRVLVAELALAAALAAVGAWLALRARPAR